jgi:hypothetical protein
VTLYDPDFCELECFAQSVSVLLGVRGMKVKLARLLHLDFDPIA